MPSILQKKLAVSFLLSHPNLRPPLWKSLDDAKREIEYGLTKCDVLKISDNEVEFLVGTTDYDKGAALIREKYNIPLVCITLGKEGSRVYYKDLRVEVAPLLQENTIETTGAGDTFLCKYAELRAGSWTYRPYRRESYGNAYLCRRSSISHYHQKRSFKSDAQP